jgi:uncharacterized Zn-binding protein involved in type VI secretion
MMPAARLGDATMHGSTLLGQCSMDVMIGNKPAWRITDQHNCTIPNAPPPACDGAPHGPGVTTPGPPSGTGVTLINNLPAARIGDIVMEPHALVPLPPPNPILQGEPTVLIGQGVGVPSVPSIKPECARAAAEGGAPFMSS